MQRKLEELGVTYSQLVDEVRYSVACCLLQDKELCVSFTGIIADQLILAMERYDS